MKNQKFKETFDWEKAEHRADEDIKAIRMHKFDIAEQVIKWLHQ
jgi:hypothetical protein